MIGKRNIIAALFATMFATTFFSGLIAGHAEGRFLAGITVLPLMAGLEEQTEQTLVFDKPNGRIIQAVAIAEAGRIDRDDVWRFYDGTLPQLGWRRLSGGKFVRDGEKLSIRVEKNHTRLTVRFAIAPGTE